MTAQPNAEPATLHERIRADIEAKILAGIWRPGHRIPFEHELTAQFGCARMTVSKAIAGLVDAGLIVRRRRVGSFVAQPRMQSVILDIPDIQADILSRGEVYRLNLLSSQRREPARGQPDEQLLAGAGELLAVRCLHLSDGRPFALEDRLIGLSAVPEAEYADFSATPPGTWLLDHVPWTEAEHRITAINADAATADLLAIENSAACLALERRTWRGKQHVTHVRQIFPGAAYDLVARFTPRSSDASMR
ncbi:MAG: histidine utilization repressor [Rhodospirillales bacterium]|nr:histidine utilization repressor [Rhodospirillales bacterium]